MNNLYLKNVVSDDTLEHLRIRNHARMQNAIKALGFKYVLAKPVKRLANPVQPILGNHFGELA